jgi:glucokinase
MDELEKRIILAGDVGGTNSRFALYEAVGKRAAPTPLLERSYPSKSYRALGEIADEFLNAAGPIENNILRATNLPWTIDGRMLASHLGIDRVTLVNDFFAAALGAVAVEAQWLAPLGGTPGVRHGPIAVLGAGTGLGVAFLLWSNSTDRYQVIPSEAGHVDFAPRTPLEAGLLQFLIHKYGRVSCERVLCGRGLVDVFTFLSQESDVYEGSLEFLQAARLSGLRIAVVSPDDHCQDVLRSAGLADLFDACIDGPFAAARRLEGQPAPDAHLAGAQALGLDCDQIAVFEAHPDAIAAGRAGHFAYVVGVDRAGRSPDLRRCGAAVVVSDLGSLLAADDDALPSAASSAEMSW